EARATDGPVDGLGARPVRGTVRRVARVTDGQMAEQPGQGALVEDGGDEAHVLDDRDGIAVTDGHAGRLLPAVLQGEEAVEGEVRDPLAGRVDAEDTACFLHASSILAQARGVTSRPMPWSGSPRRPRGRPSRGDPPSRPGSGDRRAHARAPPPRPPPPRRRRTARPGVVWPRGSARATP